MAHYEVFNWDHDGNLIDHDYYDNAWELLKDWPYSQKEVDVAITIGAKITWTTVDNIRLDWEENNG